MALRSHLRARVGMILFATAILTIAILPRLISSRVIYGPLLERLKAENFQLDVGDVQLRWFASIRLKNISIEQADRPGFNLLSIDEVITEKGLLGFLWSRNRLGRLEIISPVIDIELMQEGSNIENLAKAVGGKSTDTKTPGARPLIDIDVHVKDASVVVRKGDNNSPLVVVPSWDMELEFRSVDDEPMLTIQPTRWLDRVKLTPELMSMGLELAVPTLARSAWIDGEVSLQSDLIRVPLDRTMETTGNCEITFHSVRAGLQQPAMLAVANMLAKLARRDTGGEVVLIDGSKIEVELRDGFVYHKGTRFGLPRVDPRLQVETWGRVGFVDRSLDATIELPIPLQWLARTETIKDMGVPTVQLPVTGTLDEPQIQWMAMREESADLLSVIRTNLGDDAKARSAVVGVLEGLAGGSGDDAIRAATDVLGQLRELRNRRAADQNQASPTTSEGDDESSRTKPTTPGRTPLRDFLQRRIGS